jgi:hypothetical protein
MKLTATRKPTLANTVSIVFVRDALFLGKRYWQPILDEKTGANAVILAVLWWVVEENWDAPPFYPLNKRRHQTCRIKARKWTRPAPDDGRPLHHIEGMRSKYYYASYRLGRLSTRLAIPSDQRIAAALRLPALGPSSTVLLAVLLRAFLVAASHWIKADASND